MQPPQPPGSRRGTTARTCKEKTVGRGWLIKGCDLGWKDTGSQRCPVKAGPGGNKYSTLPVFQPSTSCQGCPSPPPWPNQRGREQGEWWPVGMREGGSNTRHPCAETRPAKLQCPGSCHLPRLFPILQRDSPLAKRDPGPRPSLVTRRPQTDGAALCTTPRAPRHRTS